MVQSTSGAWRRHKVEGPTAPLIGGRLNRLKDHGHAILCHHGDDIVIITRSIKCGEARDMRMILGYSLRGAMPPARDMLLPDENSGVLMGILLTCLCRNIKKINVLN